MATPTLITLTDTNGAVSHAQLVNSTTIVVIERLQHTSLDIHVSVDPTQIGQSLDPSLVRTNAVRIAERLRRAAADRPGVHCMMLKSVAHG